MVRLITLQGLIMTFDIESNSVEQFDGHLTIMTAYYVVTFNRPGLLSKLHKRFPMSDLGITFTYRGENIMTRAISLRRSKIISELFYVFNVPITDGQLYGSILSYYTHPFLLSFRYDPDWTLNEKQKEILSTIITRNTGTVQNRIWLELENLGKIRPNYSLDVLKFYIEQIPENPRLLAGLCQLYKGTIDREILKGLIIHFIKYGNIYAARVLVAYFGLLIEHVYYAIEYGQIPLAIIWYKFLTKESKEHIMENSGKNMSLFKLKLIA